MTQGAAGRSDSPTIVETFFGLDSCTQTLPGASLGRWVDLPIELGPESSNWMSAAALTLSTTFGPST